MRASERSAIDADRLTGDVAGGGRREEGTDGTYLLRSTDTSRWDSRGKVRGTVERRAVQRSEGMSLSEQVERVAERVLMIEEDSAFLEEPRTRSIV